MDVCFPSQPSYPQKMRKKQNTVGLQHKSLQNH